MSSTRLRVPACSAPAWRKWLLVYSSAPCRQTTEAWGAGTLPVCSPLQSDAIRRGRCLEEDGERKIMSPFIPWWATLKLKKDVVEKIIIIRLRE